MINFDPTIGAAIKKKRPGVILSSDALGILPLRITAPITGWRETFANNVWHVQLKPGKKTGLAKLSVADLLQIRSLDIRRFIKKLGDVPGEHLEEMVFALLNVVEFKKN